MWVGKGPWSRKWQPTPASYLENSTNRGAWRAAVHGVAGSRTGLNTRYRLGSLCPTDMCALLTGLEAGRSDPGAGPGRPGPLLDCSLLVFRRGRAKKAGSLWKIFCWALIPFMWVPCAHDLITSQKPHLVIPSPCPLVFNKGALGRCEHSDHTCVAS